MNAIIFIIASAYLVYLSAIDIKTYTIENKKLIPLVILALINVLSKLELISDFLLGSLLAGGSLIILALVAAITIGGEGIGGGDIKLMAILGAILGIKRASASIIILFMAAGAVSLIILLFNLLLKKNARKLPLTPFITIGFIFAYYL